MKQVRDEGIREISKYEIRPDNGRDFYQKASEFVLKKIDENRTGNCIGEELNQSAIA